MWRERRRVGRRRIVAGALAALGLASGSARAADTIALDLAAPTRQAIVPVLEPSGIRPVRVASGQDLKGRTGSVDYAVTVPQDGWYRLVADAEASIGRVAFLLDPERGGGRSIRGFDQWRMGPADVGWAWIAAGPHTLRLEQTFWTGFPAVRALSLVPVRADEEAPFTIASPFDATYAVGACAPLAVETVANREPITLIAQVQRGTVFAGQRQAVAAPSAGAARTLIDLPCDQPGDHVVSLRTTRWANRPPVRLRYAVFDPKPVSVVYEKGRLVDEIDATTRAPDFGSDPTGLVDGPAGRARVSGQNGMTALARRRTARPASVFAYRLRGTVPDRPYRVEIDYPDDARRGFTAAVWERGQTSYPVSIGVETGQEWPLSNRMATASLQFWARSPDPRLALTSVHDGPGAAAARIRVYEAVRKTAPSAPRPRGLRDFVVWGEEGEAALDSVGMRERSDEMVEGVDRWLAAAQSSGATVVMPTVVIYAADFYPSRLLTVFNSRERDVLRGILLGGQHHGLRVVPELHPRADELTQTEDPRVLARRLALSRAGRTNLFSRSGERAYPPLFNPLDPEVQDWYVGVVGELADRYRDAPNLDGISLRLMGWSNPGLNNLGSLEWGYDARTVARFFRETGETPPAGLDLANDTEPAAAARFVALTGRWREAWVAWRCARITDLHRRLRDRVRAARPDLALHLNLFGLTPDGQRSADEAWREAGIDLKALGALDGIVLVDAQHRYGRKEASPAWARDERAYNLLPESYRLARTERAPPRTLQPMEYIEAPDHVLSAADLGLPPVAKAPWTSTASNPPGRLSVERYAMALGLADALALGNGGNSGAHETPEAQAFIRLFTRLPAEPFETVADAPETVAVRQRGTVAYAVNLLPSPVRVGFTLSPGATLTGETGRLGGEATLALQPYELALLTLAGGTITRVAATASDSAQAELAARIQRRETFLATRCGGLIASRQAGCTAYAQTLDALRRDLAAGRLRTVATTLAGSRLFGQEADLGRPDLDETMSP